MTNSENLAYQNISDFLKKYDTEQPAEILADILHYCRVENIDFFRQLELAKSYVAEELALDEIRSQS